MMDRRKFIMITGSILTATTATIVPTASAKSMTPLNSNASLKKKSTQQEFLDKVGHSFVARTDNGRYWLTLEHVESGPQRQNLESFRLVFSSKTKPLPEDLYAVTHLSSFTTQPINIEPSQAMKKRFVASFCLLS